VLVGVEAVVRLAVISTTMISMRSGSRAVDDVRAPCDARDG
jgi:hypothetical protein